MVWFSGIYVVFPWHRPESQMGHCPTGRGTVQVLGLWRRPFRGSPQDLVSVLAASVLVGSSLHCNS